MELTATEYEQRLIHLYGLQDSLVNLVIAPAATTMLTQIKKRILSGKNSADGNIGNYSQKPLYAEKSAFVKPGAFKPQGKDANKGNRIVPTVLLVQARKLKKGSKFLPLVENNRKYTRFSVVKNNYEEHKTMYIEEGYKGLRDIQSLQTNHIDLKYRGDLIKDYQQQQLTQEVLQGFTLDKEAKKRAGLEGRFGSVFAPTQAEREQCMNRINANINRLTRNTIEGVYVAATIE